MTLSEIRTQFVKLTGRNDLVNGSNDNGANYFINAGQRFLDLKYRFPKDVGMYPTTLAVGGYSIVIQNYARAIKEVWVANADGRWQLNKKSYQDFLATYTKKFTLEEQGAVLDYCPAMLRIMPENAAPNAITAGYIPTLAGTSYEYNGILIGPPSEESLYVEVYGLFYSNTLTNNTDESYWSKAHPELLVRAACLQHAIDFHDSGGAKDWLGSIEEQLLNIDKDIVDEEMSEIDQMEG